MAFITVQQMSAAIAARQGLGSNLASPAHWDAIAADVVESAYQTIVAALTQRGFGPDEIAGWDRAAEFNRRIGLCHFYSEAALRGESYDAAAVDRICRCEEELETVPVTVGGELILPGGSSAGVSFGAFDTTDDIHTLDDRL